MVAKLKQQNIPRFKTEVLARASRGFVFEELVFQNAVSSSHFVVPVRRLVAVAVRQCLVSEQKYRAQRELGGWASVPLLARLSAHTCVGVLVKVFLM